MNDIESIFHDLDMFITRSEDNMRLNLKSFWANVLTSFEIGVCKPVFLQMVLKSQTQYLSF